MQAWNLNPHSSNHQNATDSKCVGDSPAQHQPEAPEPRQTITQTVTTTVLLTRGYHALIDLEDLDLISKIHWRAKVDPEGRVYAVGHKPGSGRVGISLQMHRLVMGAGPGDPLIDHRNGDTLDNRKENLRHCGNRQNVMNQRPHASGKSTSKLKGVYFMKDRRLFRAQIMCQYKKINLGSFASEMEAARAYDEAASKLFGEFARLNFPVVQR